MGLQSRCSAPLSLDKASRFEADGKHSSYRSVRQGVLVETFPSLASTALEGSHPWKDEWRRAMLTRIGASGRTRMHPLPRRAPDRNAAGPSMR